MNQEPDPRPDWTQIGHVKMYRDSVLFIRCDLLAVTFQLGRWYVRLGYGLERSARSFQSWEEILTFMNGLPLEECGCTDEEILYQEIQEALAHDKPE